MENREPTLNVQYVGTSEKQLLVPWKLKLVGMITTSIGLWPKSYTFQF